MYFAGVKGNGFRNRPPWSALRAESPADSSFVLSKMKSRSLRIRIDFNNFIGIAIGQIAEAVKVCRRLLGSPKCSGVNEGLICIGFYRLRSGYGHLAVTHVP